MIDLHTHILPGIDDGAASLDVSEAMAKCWLDQGVTHIACTPHILPGVYPNTGSDIIQRAADLQAHLLEAGLELWLYPGADNHITPDFGPKLESGELLCLGSSKYTLVEPPHHVAPQRLPEFFFGLLVAGYFPILTHPERLSWIEEKYALIQQLAAAGVWLQVTSGSLLGRFGRRPKYWADRLLEEGLVHILASDAHSMDKRPPDLAAGRDYAAERLGATEAEHLVFTRPSGVLWATAPADLPEPPGMGSLRQRVSEGSDADNRIHVDRSDRVHRWGLRRFFR